MTRPKHQRPAPQVAPRRAAVDAPSPGAITLSTGLERNLRQIRYARTIRCTGARRSPDNDRGVPGQGIRQA